MHRPSRNQAVDHDHANSALEQFRSEIRQVVRVAVAPAQYQFAVAPGDEPLLAEGATKCIERTLGRRSRMKKTDAGNVCPGLREQWMPPQHQRAAEQRYEAPPLHHALVKPESRGNVAHRGPDPGADIRRRDNGTIASHISEWRL